MIWSGREKGRNWGGAVATNPQMVYFWPGNWHLLTILTFLLGNSFNVSCPVAKERYLLCCTDMRCPISMLPFFFPQPGPSGGVYFIPHLCWGFYHGCMQSLDSSRVCPLDCRALCSILLAVIVGSSLVQLVKIILKDFLNRLFANMHT